MEKGRIIALIMCISVSFVTGNFPLHQAIEDDSVHIVRMLLNHGAEINTSNAAGETPLYLASQVGNEQVVKMLLERGVRLEARNDYQQTALHRAIRSGHSGVAHHLLKYGADANALDEGGNTPLLCALECDRDITSDVLLHLIRCGAHVNVRNKKHESPLDMLYETNAHASSNGRLIQEGLILYCCRLFFYFYDRELLGSIDEQIAACRESLTQNYIRSRTMRLLLARGALPSHEQFEQLSWRDQVVVQNRKRQVCTFLEGPNQGMLPRDLSRTVIAMAYGEENFVDRFFE